MQQPKPEILVCSSFLPQPVYIATPFNLSDGDIDGLSRESTMQPSSRFSSERKRLHLRVGRSQSGMNRKRRPSAFFSETPPVVSLNSSMSALACEHESRQ